MTDPSRRTRAEVWIVLGLSLGQSAVYAVISALGYYMRTSTHFFALAILVAFVPARRSPSSIRPSADRAMK